MGLSRRVGLSTGLKYKGGGPMWAWVLHRVTGLAILLFVGTHVLASFFMHQLNCNLGTAINTVYESWIFQIVVIFVVLFHAFNGMRIAILDIWPQLQQFQREALWLQIAIFLPIYGMAVFFLVQNGLTGG